ncbi:hypothetical protein A2U01_0111716, partial [Trifolium medium]|nr:hypothetical protein [Trifolium medium]
MVEPTPCVESLPDK